jgi:hypothetical protein
LKLERTLKKKRGFIGYNPREVRTQIQFLQAQHQKGIELLRQEIKAEKEKNQSLLAELEEKNKQPVENSIAQELTAVLHHQFIQQTQAILELKDQCAEKQRIKSERLEQKEKQKELVQKSIRDALEYLNKQKNELQKELIK